MAVKLGVDPRDADSEDVKSSDVGSSVLKFEAFNSGEVLRNEVEAKEGDPNVGRANVEGSCKAVPGEADSDARDSSEVNFNVGKSDSEESTVEDLSEGITVVDERREAGMND